MYTHTHTRTVDKHSYTPCTHTHTHTALSLGLGFRHLSVPTDLHLRCRLCLSESPAQSSGQMFNQRLPSLRSFTCIQKRTATKAYCSKCSLFDLDLRVTSLIASPRKRYSTVRAACLRSSDCQRMARAPVTLTEEQFVNSPVCLLQGQSQAYFRRCSMATAFI